MKVHRIVTMASSGLVVALACSIVSGQQPGLDENSLVKMERDLDRLEADIWRKLSRNEARRLAHNEPKNRPNPKDKAAVDRFNKQAKEGKAEGERLDRELDDVQRRRGQLAAEWAKLAMRTESSWLGGRKPPPEVELALREVVHDPAWPISARQFLLTVPFVWRPGARSSPGLPDLLAAYDKAQDALVIKAGFAGCEVEVNKRRDVIAFEFGKLLRDRQTPEYRTRFDDEFAGYILRELGHLPAAPDVLERDIYAAFAYAYRHFLFDRAKLPKELAVWWLEMPPHGGQAQRKDIRE